MTTKSIEEKKDRMAEEYFDNTINFVELYRNSDNFDEFLKQYFEKGGTDADEANTFYEELNYKYSH